MIFRQLTANGDFTFGQGIAGYATGQQAIDLDIKTALLSWKNDCFWSLNDFVDWFNRLEKNQFANLETELKQVILQRFGVVAVLSLTTVYTAETRNFQITYTISTIYSSSVQNQLNLAAGLPSGSSS